MDVLLARDWAATAAPRKRGCGAESHLGWDSVPTSFALHSDQGCTKAPSTPEQGRTRTGPAPALHRSRLESPPNEAAPALLPLLRGFRTTRCPPGEL
jgi:hypothetical protein